MNISDISETFQIEETQVENTFSFENNEKNINFQVFCLNEFYSDL